MFIKLIRRGLAALGLLSIAALPSLLSRAQAALPSGKSPDKDTTVYLFGTIHLLPQDSRWRTPEFDKAVDSSQSLVVETLIDTANPQKLQA